MAKKVSRQQMQFAGFLDEAPSCDAGAAAGVGDHAPQAGANAETDEPPLQDRLVMVIDAPSLIYQVFHAIDSVTGPAGQQLNAVFGFTRDLLDLLEKQRPDFLFCALDHPGETFRHAIYPQYKATRAEMPEELRPQMPAIRRMLAAMRIPVLEIAGYEADDILATIAHQAELQGARCWLVTNDKDCRQLISERVWLYNTRKNEWMDPDKLYEVWGVRPNQVADFQALVGDTVDAIPGVPLIGPKLAQQLLHQFETLTGVFQNLDHVAGAKRRQNLKEHQEQALISRQLVELDRATPMQVDWRAGQVSKFDEAAVSELCREFGFRRLAERLQQHVSHSPPLTSTPPCEVALLICEPKQLAEMVDILRSESEILVHVIATPGHPRWAELIGLGLAAATGASWYVPLQAPPGESVCSRATFSAAVQPLWEDGQLKKAGPQLKEADVLLRRWGWRMAGPAFDYGVADYLTAAGERGHELADLAERYLGRRDPGWRELLGGSRRGIHPQQSPAAEMAHIAGVALQVGRELRRPLQEQLEQMALLPLFNDLEMPLLSALADMEFQGIHLDVAVLDRIRDEFAHRLSELQREIHVLAGGPFNIDSRTQLSEMLFQTLGLPVLKKTKTGPSTDAEVLHELAAQHPLPAKVIEYRQVAKLKSTYVDALPALVHPETGRVHTSFRQDVAATGRLSSQDPNLQNIPIRGVDGRRIRSAFTAAPPGWTLLAADYSQIELRVLAHFCGDAELMRAFEAGQDIHTQVAAEIQGVALDAVTPQMRRQAKAINFGVIYGQSPFGLAKALQIPQEDAARFIDAYFERFPGVETFVIRTLDDCRQRGFVSTILGRRRQVHGVRSAERRAAARQRTLPERIAVNTVIQGSAADLIKLAILRVDQALSKQPLPARLLLTIHDELLLETPQECSAALARLVRQQMEGAASLRVPLAVDVKIGSNWADCEVWRDDPEPPSAP